MSSTHPDPNDRGRERLGGARAEFVSSLGRKVKDARELLTVLEEDPSSKTARDELRRRLHALGAAARLLRFDAMGRSIQEALDVLDRATLPASTAKMGNDSWTSPAVLREQVGFVAQVLDDLPALAWAEASAREPSEGGGEDSDAARGPMPVSVLVIGGESLADGLTEETSNRARVFECERTEEMPTALGLARAYAPDLIVVDSDLRGAAELVEALLDDPLTEPVPVIVVGTFGSPDEASRFVALGVGRTLAKPLAPELVRATCEDILDGREGRTTRITLGEPTLEQLANRLAEELKRALIDSVERSSRSRRVPLGEGSEVLGALWGAIARVQEIVSQKTNGAIRFGGVAPEGAVALAPWLHQEVPGADRSIGRGRNAGADVRLSGRRVVVADDDPGVTWFLSDLLRTAGCEVHEALDGLTALHLAHRVQPELIVSDILMPGLDGFALCRAVRRDVALRDTPVILLSWKEDLLQRVRELGASAAAYMRKESDSRAVLARVREVLRPRARLEMRMRGEGEVRGRLDGLTSRLLLDLVCLIRKDARVSVRDATNFYEIEIRAGAPRKATRTATDGKFQSGEPALASLLGVGAGRFAIASSREPVRAELTGSLFEQLARPIAAARGALEASTGARTVHVERIAIDEEALEDYLRVTPDPSAAAIKKIAAGMSPRQMLLDGAIAPSLLEDLLADLAARGAIRAVEGAEGEDFLTPAVTAALAVLHGAPPASRSLPPNARPSAGPRHGSPSERGSSRDSLESSSPPPPAAMGVAGAGTGAVPSAASPSPPANPSARAIRRAEGMAEGPAPSSLEDALIRELSGHRTRPEGAPTAPSDPPPIVEPSELRKRSSNPPAMPTSSPSFLATAEEVTDDRARLPSIPSDAMVPASTSEEVLAAAPVASGAGGAPVVSVPSSPSDPDRSTGSASTPATPIPTTAEETGAAARSRRRRVLVAIAVLLGVALLSAMLRWMTTDSGDRASAPFPAASSGPMPAVTPSTAGASDLPPPAEPGGQDELPPGSEVPVGFGLLEIAAPPGATVRIDGAPAGSGPSVSAVAAPGAHDVRVDHAGRESKDIVEVRAGKATHVKRTLIP